MIASNQIHEAVLFVENTNGEAKKMGAQSPCNIFCLDPMEGMIRGIEPNYSFNAAETLWTGQKCEVNLIKEIENI